jgi:hypothetical protein
LKARTMTDTTAPEYIWGAKAIAAAIGRSEKATFAMLERGVIAGARKVGGRWSLRPAVYARSFDEAAA